MQLARALRLTPVPRLAFVGAGGKTSALFHLANELKNPSRQAGVSRAAPNTVLVTTTTHLAVDQLRRADHHFIIQSPQDITRLQAGLPEGSVLLTGPATAGERVSGLQPEALEQLYLLAEASRLPLLVEADGSRRLPLKAPAEHEPDVPAWVDSVVVVAGVSALGRPSSSEWVHRPERFSVLAGLVPGEVITPNALGRVLISPEGGLKGIPPAARRVALLNQADNAALKSLASGMSSTLLKPGCYEAVLITTLEPPVEQGVDNEIVWAVHEPVSGIILAAGESQRLGKPKQLLEWRGQPLVRHVARTALESGLSPVVLVSGAYAAEVERAVADLPLAIAPNPAWQEGQSTSLAAGLQAIPFPVGGAVFLLSDQPQIPATLVRSLVELHARTLSPLVAPEIDGRRANPVLFDRQTFPALLALQGDTGGRPLFSRFPVAWLPWHDLSLLIDVDTEEDYARLQQL